MKNAMILPLMAVMVFAVMFTSGCTTGQVISTKNTTDTVHEKAVNSSNDLVVTGNIVLKDNVPVIDETENMTEGQKEVVDMIDDIKSSSSGGGGSSSSSSSPPPKKTNPPPVEVHEYTYTVNIESDVNVVSADFLLTFPEGTEIVGNPAVGDFLGSDGIPVIGPYKSNKTGQIRVGFVRNPTRTGVSGSGELGSVTFMVENPSDIKLTDATVIGEKVNGSLPILDSIIDGNTIKVQ